MNHLQKILAAFLLALCLTLGLPSLSQGADKKPETAPSAAAPKPFDVKAAIAAGDHKGLAEYYKGQAEIYRKKAAEHDAMQANYKSSHAYTKGMENSFGAHCTKLKKDALSSAEKYDALAQQEEKLAAQ